MANLRFVYTQLGDGSLISKYTPVDIPVLRNIYIVASLALGHVRLVVLFKFPGMSREICVIILVCVFVANTMTPKIYVFLSSLMALVIVCCFCITCFLVPLLCSFERRRGAVLGQK